MPQPKKSIKTVRPDSITDKFIEAGENAALNPTVLLPYADLISFINDLMDAKVRQLRNELKHQLLYKAVLAHKI